MKDSDYADMKCCLVSLAGTVESAVRQLREGANADLVADFLQGAMHDGAQQTLNRDRAHDEIVAFEIPEGLDATDAVKQARDVVAGASMVDEVADTSMFVIDAYDPQFDTDFHDKYDSLAYETAHLVVVRRDGEDSLFLRISPSDEGFSITSCYLFEDLYSVSHGDPVGTAGTLAEAIDVAQAAAIQPERTLT